MVPPVPDLQLTLPGAAPHGNHAGAGAPDESFCPHAGELVIPSGGPAEGV